MRHIWRRALRQLTYKTVFPVALFIVACYTLLFSHTISPTIICFKTACQTDIRTTGISSLLAAARRTIWSRGLHRRQGGIHYIELHRDGATSFGTRAPALTEGLSLEAWVYLHAVPNSKIVLVQYGAFSLQLLPHSVPAMLLESEFRHFTVTKARRGNCGDLELPPLRRTRDLQEAIQICARMPGCAYVTREKGSKRTFFCRGAYDASHDADWEVGAFSPQHVLDGAAGSQQGLQPATWHHLVATLSADHHRARLFVNGYLTQDFHVHHNASHAPRMTEPGGRVWVGADPWGVVVAPARRHPSLRIGNVRAWAQNLSIAQLQDSMWRHCITPGTNALLLDAAGCYATRQSQPIPEGQEWLKSDRDADAEFPVSRMGWRPVSYHATPAPVVAEPVCVLAVTRETSMLALQRRAAWLSQHHGCVACGVLRVVTVVVKAEDVRMQPLPLEASTITAGTALEVVAAETWSGALQKGLGAASGCAFVAVLIEDVIPSHGWLSPLLAVALTDPSVGAVSSVAVYEGGRISSAGSVFRLAFNPELDQELPLPVALQRGRPLGLLLNAQPPHVLDCTSVLLRGTAIQGLARLDGSEAGELGAEFTCVAISLHVRERQLSVAVANGSVVFVNQPIKASEIPAPLPPLAFYDRWGTAARKLMMASALINSSLTMAMASGQGPAKEVYYLANELEGLLPLRTQIKGPVYELLVEPQLVTDTMQVVLPAVERMRYLSSFIPSDIVLFARDHSLLADWQWPVGNTSSYLIGRASWNSYGPVEAQAQQMREELDEVWVPNDWHLSGALASGVPAAKVFVVPESVDTSVVDARGWDVVTLPDRRRFNIFTVFTIEEEISKSTWWKAIAAYLEEFRGVPDVSLYCHVCLVPSNRCDRDVVMSTIMRTLEHFTGVAYKLFPFVSGDLPQLHIFGRRLQHQEIMQLYVSTHTFLLVSASSRLYGLEAMSMSTPLVSLAENAYTSACMDTSNAFILNETAVSASAAPTAGFSKPRKPPTIVSPNAYARMAADVVIQRSKALLRAAYSASPSTLHSMGLLARTRVVAGCSVSAVMAFVVQRLRAIDAVLKPPSQPVSPRLAHSLEMYGNGLLNLHVCSVQDGQPLTRPRTLQRGQPLRLAVISTWPPRKCGIATFAANTVNSLLKVDPTFNISVFPIVTGQALAHGSDAADPLVAKRIRQFNIGDYIAAATYINTHGFHVLLLEHEFGIYGGDTGAFAVCLIRMLRIPVLAVVHTLSDDLTDAYHYVLLHIVSRVDVVVVMSAASKAALGAYHGIPAGNVDVIPHGVPETQCLDPDVVKPELGWGNRTVLFTNGLLHAGKGVDLVVRALPAVVAAHPAVLYVIVGEPHPTCSSCKEYYADLIEMVSTLGLANNVQFISSFQEQSRLVRLLQGADMFIMAYRDRTTTNSGTLSMALAAGKVVVATPFEHARAVLPQRGIFVEFEDVSSIEDALIMVVGDRRLQRRYAREACSFSRRLGWQDVARQYAKRMYNMSLVE